MNFETIVFVFNEKDDISFLQKKKYLSTGEGIGSKLLSRSKNCGVQNEKRVKYQLTVIIVLI